MITKAKIIFRKMVKKNKKNKNKGNLQSSSANKEEKQEEPQSLEEPNAPKNEVDIQCQCAHIS